MQRTKAKAKWYKGRLKEYDCLIGKESFPIDKVNRDQRAHDPTFGGACPSDALDGRAEKGEGKQASQPVHSAAVWVISFLSQAGRETFVEGGGHFGHAPRGRKDQGREGSMLHLANTLFIGSLFYVFVPAITRRQWDVAIGMSMRVKNTNIKESTLVSSTPDATCDNVQTSTFLSV